MLFSLWADAPYRATGDLDLLGAGENTPDKLASIFQEIFAVEVEDDGILFRPDTLRAAAARAEDEYAGVRIDFLAELAGARLPMHVDIGFGDAVRSEEHTSELQSLMRISYAVFCLKKKNNKIN